MKNWRSYRDLLVESYNDKKSRRPGYSLRAFARDLSMTPSHLNDVLYGRRGLSLASASRIADVLQLSEKEKDLFVDLVEHEHGRSQSVRNLASLRIEKRKRKSAHHVQDSETAFLKSWITPAILEIISTKNGLSDPATVSEFLGVTKSAVIESLELLKQLGLVKAIDERLVRVSDYFFAASATSNAVLRNFHKQILKLADQRFEEVPTDKRENLSTIMSFDESKTNEAKDFIAEMHDEFITKFGSSRNAGAVFVLTQHFFQLDIGNPKK